MIALDLANLIESVARLPTTVNFGGAGVFDSTVVAGVVAALLAEAFGERLSVWAGHNTSLRSILRSSKLLQSIQSNLRAILLCSEIRATTWSSSNSAMGMVVESVSRPRPLILTIVSCLALSVIAVASTAQAERELSIDEGYFEILDEEGNILTATGLVVSIDDIFIDSSNRSYRIESITEQKHRRSSCQ